MGRSPHGERGLKSRLRRLAGAIACRSPHGERGLKWWHVGANLARPSVALLTESVD